MSIFAVTVLLDEGVRTKMVKNDVQAEESDAGTKQQDLKLRPSSSAKNVTIFGFFIVALIFIGVGGWSATAPLARAVSAAATLTVKGERKSIQHFEGGIIGSIHVSEGQFVKKGDLLVALNPLQANANASRHYAQLDQALALEARLLSELNEEEGIILTGQLLDRVEKNDKILDILEAEEKHFYARRDTVEGHIAILKQRIDQLDKEIEGLQIQRESRLVQYEIFQKELVGLRSLYSKGYYPKSKILAMERAIADLRGSSGNDLAQIARSKSSQRESENQIISVKQRFREDVVRELRDVQGQISDLNERVLIASDILQRVEIRAPRSGIVQGVQVHTVGGVIKPGDVLMEIAPQDDELVVRAQVAPTDIDSIAIGQKAEVRLTSLNARTTPAIFGSVVSVSGDRLLEQRTNKPFFLTRVEIPAEERDKLGETKLSAGMPAEVLIQTGERTALEYLLRPIIDAFARGLNEE